MSELAETRPLARASIGGVRSSSARALLLVVLGEFVWPRKRPVWSSTLLRALADLNVEPNAARKALQRTAQAGITETDRSGRRSRWSVTPEGDRLLASGHERMWGWENRATDWDGRWLVLSVTVPESQRRLRHHLQSRLAWAGVGALQSGQWLTPHWQRGPEIARIIDDLGLQDQAHSFVGELGPVGDEHRLLETAWNLDELAADYRRFLEVYRNRCPSADQECMQARVAMVQDYRRFPYLDPDLPARFLPDSWPGRDAAALFRALYESWSSPADRYWDRIVVEE